MGNLAFHGSSVRALAQCAAALGAGAVLSGCVSWPDNAYRPNVPAVARLPFVDQAWEKHKGGRALTLNHYKDTLRTVLKGVMAEAEGKNDQLWDYSMTTLVGGSAATLGALHGATGLTNTGLAVAAGGQTVKTYYNPQQAKGMHVAAHGKLACIATEISNLSETKRVLAVRSGQPGSAEAGEALAVIARAVDTVLNGYRDVLLGMAPQVSTRDDLLRFAAEYKEKTEQAKQQVKSAGDAPAGEGDDDDSPTATLPAAAASAAPAVAAPIFIAPAPMPAASGIVGTITFTTGSTGAGKRYAAMFLDLKVRLEVCTRPAVSPS